MKLDDKKRFSKHELNYLRKYFKIVEEDELIRKQFFKLIENHKELL